MLIDKFPQFKEIIQKGDFNLFYSELKDITNVSKDKLFQLFNKYREKLELEPLTILIDDEDVLMYEGFLEMINKGSFQNYQFDTPSSERLNEKFKSKAQAAYFYAEKDRACKKDKDSEKCRDWSKWTKEFSADTDWKKLPKKVSEMDEKGEENWAMFAHLYEKGLDKAKDEQDLDRIYNEILPKLEHDRFKEALKYFYDVKLKDLRGEPLNELDMTMFPKGTLFKTTPNSNQYQEDMVLKEGIKTIKVSDIKDKLHDFITKNKERSNILYRNIKKAKDDIASGKIKTDDEALKNLKNTITDIAKIVGQSGMFLIPLGGMSLLAFKRYLKTKDAKKRGLDKLLDLSFEQMNESFILNERIMQPLEGSKFIEVAPHCKYNYECNQGEISNFKIGGPPNMTKVNENDDNNIDKIGTLYDRTDDRFKDLLGKRVCVDYKGKEICGVLQFAGVNQLHGKFQVTIDRMPLWEVDPETIRVQEDKPKISDIKYEGEEKNDDEKESMKYRFGALMLQFPIKNWDEITSMINPEDVYNDETGELGIEKEPHVTALFGFHDEVDFEKDIKPLLLKYDRPLEATLKKVSHFSMDNREFDVVKFDVESEDLVKLNKELAKLPHTNEFEYHPHMTVSYVKKGTGKDYDKELKEPVTIQSSSFKWSDKNKDKKYFDIFDGEKD